ncbi:MAG: helix-turn-helix transcriptional regulator [Actinobacteria bacterium]|nr:helix-turn-helix transcriptional regulator [Actinomycetota bacterium]
MADGVEQRLRDLGEFIRNQREGARLSLRGLSSRTGISNPYLSQIERGLRKPSAEILQQIARGLAISAETLYERAGILDARDAGAVPDVVAAISRATDLDDQAKTALIGVYQSLRRPPPAGDGPDGSDGDPAPPSSPAAGTETPGR